MLNFLKTPRWSGNTLKELIILAVCMVIALVLFLIALLVATVFKIEFYHPSAAIVGGLSLVLLYWLLRSVLIDNKNEYHPIEKDSDAVMSHKDIVRAIYYRGNEAVIQLLDNGETACAADVARLIKEVPLSSHYHANHHFYHELVKFTDKHTGHHWIEQYQWYYRNRFGESPADTDKPAGKRVQQRGARMQLFAGVIGLMLVLAPTYDAQAQTSDASSALLYYRIGGANAGPIPPSYSKSVVIDGDLRLQPELACGALNLEENLEYLFDSLKDGLDRAVDLIVYAATNALAELPFYLLRRADPNLANMFENGLSRYEELIRLSAKSCNEIHKEVVNGDNPYANWRKWGSAAYWREWLEKARNGEEAIATEIEKGEKEGKTGCVVWIDGEERACDGKPPIYPVEEICENGYTLLTEGITDGSGFDGEDTRLKDLFPTQADACEWMVDTLGDFEIDFSDEAVPIGQTPIGVYNDLNTRAVEIYDALVILMDDANVYNGDYVHTDVFDLPGFEITNTAIQAVRELPINLRERTIRRVSTEYSILITMEIINQARRILIVGASDPHVSTTEPAWELVNNYALPKLLEEYDLLKDESELRRTLAQTTVATVVEAVQNSQSGVPNYSGASEDNDVIINGALIEDD